METKERKSILHEIEKSFMFIWYKNEYVKVSVGNIVYCKADRCYTNIKLNNGKAYLISKPLAYVENYLKDENFIRCHHSFLVNTVYIEKYCSKTKSLFVNGQKISVSRRKSKWILLEIKNNSLIYR